MEDSMEDGKETVKSESADNTSSNESTENEPNDATGKVSSEICKPGSEVKASGDTKLRFMRLKILDQVMQKSMKRFIDFVSFNKFASMCRPLYKKNPQKTKSLYKRFKEELQKGIQEKINKIIEEGQIVYSLNALEKLENAVKSYPAPACRPSGVPEQNFHSSMMSYYQKQAVYMQRKLKRIRAENAALARTVQAGRESISQIEQSISSAANEWKASAMEIERKATSLPPADVFLDI